MATSTPAERVAQRFVTALNNPRQVTDHDRGTLVLIESQVLNLAEAIETFVPESRNKSIALTALEDVLTRANKEIYATGALTGPEVVD